MMGWYSMCHHSVIEAHTWSGAGGRASVQRDVRLSGALRLRVVALDLLLLLWPRQAVLSVAVGQRGGHQQGLLGGRGGRRQVQGSNLLSHQLLLDLVNEHQVIQLKGLTGHAQQTTATLCECHSRPCDYDYVGKTGHSHEPLFDLLRRSAEQRKRHSHKETNGKKSKIVSDACYKSGHTWPGMDGGGGQKYGLLNRGSAILKGEQS